MILYTLYFILGLVVGSFLNVVIDRLETGESIVAEPGETVGGTPRKLARSFCPHCKTRLKWYDLVPVFSFLILKGKCRYCQKNISWQYPVVELATGVLFVLVSVSGLQFLDFVYWLFIISCLIIIFVYDLKHYIIPDKVLFPAVGVVSLYNLYPELVEGFMRFLPFLLSAAGACVFFLAIILATKGRGMGLGDAKLAFLMGLILGWPEILLALFLAFLSGALIGLGLIVVGQKTLKSQIPFAPFLSASTIIVLFFSSQIFTP